MGSYLKFLEGVVPHLVNIHSVIPESHPSAAILGRERSGTGTLVDPEGFILTVGYVVMGARSLSVTLADGTKCRATPVGHDFETGLSVIRMDGKHPGPMRLGRSSELRPGARVVLVATTGPARHKGADGIVTSVESFDAYWEYMLDSAIKATAINPGLGGGALVTFDGIMQGVVSLNISLVGSCSLSIPIDLFHARRDELLGREQYPERRERPWLGFFPQPLEQGVYVAGVVPGGPAAKAGMQEGDVVLSLNGEEISSRRQLYESLWKGKAGNVIALTVYRDKAFKTIELVSESRADFFR